MFFFKIKAGLLLVRKRTEPELAGEQIIIFSNNTSLPVSLYLSVSLQSFASEMNSLVGLHELYKYINKYYDQVNSNTCAGAASVY